MRLSGVLPASDDFSVLTGLTSLFAKVLLDEAVLAKFIGAIAVFKLDKADPLVALLVLEERGLVQFAQVDAQESHSACCFSVGSVCFAGWSMNRSALVGDPENCSPCFVYANSSPSGSIAM